MFAKKYILYAKSEFYKLYFKLKYQKCLVFGKNLKFYGKPMIKIQKKGRILLGNNVIIISKTKYNYVGISKVFSAFIEEDATLEIGDNSGFSGVSIYCKNKITIGKYCKFGGNVSIWDTDFHPIDYLKRRSYPMNKNSNHEITIGDDVFIGANSIILKGVKIGDRSIIGAGSIVTKNIPSEEIWGGNPARFLKKIN